MAASLSKTLRLHRLLSIPRNSARTLPLSVFSISEAKHRPPPPPPPPPSSPPPPPPFASVAAPSVSQVPEKERGRWSKLLLFLPGAITFGLGTWQLFRRQEKIEMLDYMRKRLEMEPIMWNERHSLGHDMASLEFRRVICQGYFDETKSIYVGPRSRSISGVTENGYYLITPLIPETTHPGSMQLPILVNRGWVPRGWRDKSLEVSQNVEKASNLETGDAKRNEQNVWWKFWSKSPAVSKAEEPVMAPVRVIGVIRGSEKPSIFVPANDPNNGQWFYVDISMIACACGLPENTIYVEDINDDASATNPYPVPKDVNTLIRQSVMPQDHVNYAITWYSLSAAVTYMAVKRVRPKKIKR